jgi:predicted permease
VLHDLKSVLRSVHTRPGPSIVAVTCLAFGIGVNIALFGLIDALMFRPPVGVSDSESLVRVRVGANTGPLTQGSGPTASYPQYERIAAERIDLLVGLAAYAGGTATRDPGLDARPVSMTIVTPNYFSLLGVHPRFGLFFDAEEAGSSSGVPAAVLSHRYWRDSFNADEAILGRTLRVNGVALTVIGVAPEGFVGVDLGDPDVWIPIGLRELPEFGGVDLSASRGLYWLQFVGRLRQNVTLEQALAMTAPADAGTDPFVPRPVMEDDNVSASLPVAFLPLRTMFFADQRGRNPIPLWALLVSAAILVLACATVANLLLIQAVRRRREIAIRLAIGGSPARIVRSQIIESVLLASIAMVIAMVFAAASVGLLEQLPIPPIGSVVNTRSATLGVGLTLLAPLLFGVAPALWAARRRVGDVLKEGSQHGVAAASRLQRGFMAAQTTVGFVLLLLAALFLQSLENVRDIDTGMDLDRVVMASVDPGPSIAGRPPHELLSGALDRIRRLPGVEAAAVGGIVPFYLFSRSGFSIVDGRAPEEQPQVVGINVIGPEYFATMGINVTSGRGIAELDGPGSPPVAVVSERLALMEWPGISPLGSCLRLSTRFGDACVEVVGVASDVRFESVFADPSPVLFLANAQVPERAQSSPSRLFVRARGDRAEVAGAVRSELQSLDPSMPFVDVEPLDARIRPQRLQWEVGAGLFTSLGALAALLGGVGLYSVVSFGASQRTRELGIRTALGAGRARLLRLELWSGIKICGFGITSGTLMGLGVARYYDSQLYGLGYLDLRSYLAVAALLTVIGVLASLQPAWKAAGADPAILLREE